MKIQTIIWTALPNGISPEGKLRLSVLVSPRLETDEIITGRLSPILRQFEDFIDWPSIDLKFSIAFDDGGVVRQLPAVITSKPDSNIWRAMFKIDLPVDSYTFDDYSSRIVRSYPAVNIMAFIEKEYQRIAITNPTKFSPYHELIRQQGDSFAQLQIPLDRQDVQLTDLEKQLNEVLSKYGAVPPNVSLNTTLNFFQLSLFHRTHNHVDKELTSKNTHPIYNEYKQTKLENKFDFHRVISLLQTYPKLLRLFGLVFDIEVTIPSGVNVPVYSAIWVVPVWSTTLPNSKNITPRTQYAKGFRAQPGTSELRDGMLDLSGPLYGLIEVDVDGAALKAMNFASSIKLSQENMKTADTPDSFSVPSLQSAGLSLVRSGRGYSLKQDLVKSKKNNDDIASNKIVTLYAEDLIGGFRVDIFDRATRNWYSLCDRIATYKFVDARISPIVMEDEGYVSLAATESATGLLESPKSSSPDLYLSEALFRWSGWSLCVPRPTTRLSTVDPFQPTGDVIVSPQSKMLSTFSLKKQSLPRLRFGNSYRMRVRIADLAGAGLTKEQASTAFVTKEVRYLRYEPIIAPVVVLHHPIENRPGESTERLVIRTRNDLPEKDLVDPPTSEISERHIAPPLCAPSIAETHGKFDDEAGLRKDAYGTIVSKEGTFQKVHTESILILPYLPDPLSRGASFLGLPGQVKGLLGISGAPDNKEIENHSDGSVLVTDLPSIENPPINLIKVDFGPENGWPDSRPFLVRIQGILEGKAPIAPKWDALLRVLTLNIPQATVLSVRLSSYPGKEQITLLGIWDWIKNSKLTTEELSKLGYSSMQALVEQLFYYSMQGRHWMMTPYRDVVLVHAVQQPLGRVDFTHLTSTKTIGNTFAVLDDDPLVHVKSTGTIEVFATWNETIDDLNNPTPTTPPVQRSAQAFRFNLDYPDPTDPKGKNLKKISHSHEFGDTKYRSVAYTLSATTRFQDYFEKNPNNIFTRISKSVTIDVLNSARPEAPKVLYVIPTFGWERIGDRTKYESIRKGGGLRVYLDRPWFSSGDGEMLGIILAGPNSSPSELERLKAYITRWGGDPIWSSISRTVGPLESDFKNKTKSELGITLEELGDIGDGNNYSLWVVGYNIDSVQNYDKIRKLWYCDVEIDTHGQYFPFIRLALVRYQPKSVKTIGIGKTKDVKVSRVVLADFVQLAPDRTASLTFVNSDRSVSNLAISGIPGIGKNEYYNNEIEVSIEKRDPTKGGRDLGWTFVFKAEPSQSIPSGMLWLGTIKLPGPGHKIYRIVVKEFEKINVEIDGPIGKRMVYSEIFEL